MQFARLYSILSFAKQTEFVGVGSSVLHMHLLNLSLPKMQYLEISLIPVFAEFLLLKNINCIYYS